jgi:uncharacterized protein (DUF488 family)
VPVLYTVGHGTASQQELTERLSGVGVQRLVDVRTAPGSRKHPHVARSALSFWLPAEGIEYRWEPRLGGFRRPAKDSPDVVWRNDSFRGYAAHLRSADARAAVADLTAEASRLTTIVMCSETLWWRCHRRLIADAMTCLHGFEVRHLMANGYTGHHVTPGCRVVDGALIYDVTSA